MKPLARKTSPFAGPTPKTNTKAHWIEPQLVGEIGFTEWTRDGILRHPAFLGLRSDKDATSVVRERETAADPDA
jgi:bifunctional non-homologous end joining protein LigD